MMSVGKQSFKSVGKTCLINTLTSRYLNALGHYFVPQLLPVFALHRFENRENNTTGHNPEFLDQVLGTLRKKGYSFLGLDEAIDLFGRHELARRKLVAFTMDDGFDDQVRTGAEIFGAHDCPVTCFLITDFIDGIDWPWDSKVGYIVNNITETHIKIELESGSYNLDLSNSAKRRAAAHDIRHLMKLSASRNVASQLDSLMRQAGVQVPGLPPESLKPVSWDTARALERKGMRFGAHGMSHHILAAQTDEQVKREVSGSWGRLSQELTTPSRVFCYPVGKVGDYSKREQKIVQGVGYHAAVSAEPGYVSKRTLEHQRYSLPRFAFPDSLADILQYCSWIEYAKGKLLR